MTFFYFLSKIKYGLVQEHLEEFYAQFAGHRHPPSFSKTAQLRLRQFRLSIEIEWLCSETI